MNSDELRKYYKKYGVENGYTRFCDLLDKIKEEENA